MGVEGGKTEGRQRSCGPQVEQGTFAALSCAGCLAACLSARSHTMHTLSMRCAQSCPHTHPCSEHSHECPLTVSTHVSQSHV